MKKDNFKLTKLTQISLRKARDKGSNKDKFFRVNKRDVTVTRTVFNGAERIITLIFIQLHLLINIHVTFFSDELRMKK